MNGERIDAGHVLVRPTEPLARGLVAVPEAVPLILGAGLGVAAALALALRIRRGRRRP